MRSNSEATRRPSPRPHSLHEPVAAVVLTGVGEGDEEGDEYA